MRFVLLHIVFFVFANHAIHAQTYVDYGEVEEEEQSYDATNYAYEDYKDSKAQKEYLNKPIEKKRFDRGKWTRLREKIIEDYSGEEAEGHPIGKGNNPYGTSKKRYRERWNRQKAENTRKQLVKPKEIKTPPPSRNSGLDRLFDFEVSPVVGWIFIGIIIAILVALIFYLFFNTKINKQDKKIDRVLEDIPPTEIPKSELELLLEKALANKDYREAVRIYFIFVVRGLSEKEMINWEKEKTNYGYLIEMRKNELYNQFDQSVLLYELVWYGKREVQYSDYQNMEPIFKNLINKIEK